MLISGTTNLRQSDPMDGAIQDAITGSGFPMPGTFTAGIFSRR